MNVFLIPFLTLHYIDHTVDFYATNHVNGMYVMVHIGQATVPASLKETQSFVDDIEVF